MRYRRSILGRRECRGRNRCTKMFHVKHLVGERKAWKRQTQGSRGLGWRWEGTFGSCSLGGRVLVGRERCAGDRVNYGEVFSTSHTCTLSSGVERSPSSPALRPLPTKTRHPLTKNRQIFPPTSSTALDSPEFASSTLVISR